jgi:alkylation response protein AidB-like acyl-CoA dehydrogenase
MAQPNPSTLAAASVAVAEAKVLTTEVALAATNKLFELSGTQSTLSAWNLDRYWRNARTHTLHDPVRWKPFIIGNFILNETLPPRHGAI